MTNISNKSTFGNIKIAHLNIRSIKNRAHFIEAREFVTTNNIDIFTISETWLNSTVKNVEIEIDGYKLIRLDRLHRKGGGVCAYIRSSIKASRLKDLSSISDTNFHQLWIQLQCNKLKSIVICVTYRPPDCELDCFDLLLKPNYTQALLLRKPVLILGDLNCNILKPGPECKALKDFIAEFNLTNIINSPTRVTNTSTTLIDVILLSAPSLVESSGVINTTISDHFTVYAVLRLKLPKTQPNYRTTRSYKNYEPTAFLIDLAPYVDTLDIVHYKNDVNEKLATLNDALFTILDIHAPVKTFKIKSRPCPYVTVEIKTLMKQRDTLHRIFLRTRRESDWNNYKLIRNQVKVILKQAEENYTKRNVLQHKNNSNSLWKIINRCIPSKSTTKLTYSKDHLIVANEFNKYFSSVGSLTAQKVTQLALDHNIDISNSNPDHTQYLDGEQFNFRRVSCYDVQKIVLSMPSNKSPGIDQISTQVLKDSLPIILPALTDIINSSLTTSTFPDAWKKSVLIPLQKEGDHEIASNNRPLSLLVVASKVCEKIALNQFSDYLTTTRRLTPNQSGNKKYHSTETLNIAVSDAILAAMDKKMLSALILMDLSKAFDSVDHLILLHKLSKIGASPATVKWFQSYLSNRTQIVRIGSSLSSPLLITHGVPQGAILSPLLFCIYINDLPDLSLTSLLESYVDDSKLLLSFTIQDVDNAMISLQDDLSGITKWCCVNKLLINPTKTKFMLIGTRQLLLRLPDEMSLSILGESLRPTISASDLGVTLDSHLTYDDHITKTISSCMAKLCQIYRVKDSFDRDTLILIIQSLVMSKLYYCSTVWANTSSTNIKKLQLVQNFAARIITNTRKHDHITPTLKELKWLPVKKHLIYRDIIMTFKCLNGMTPSYLSDEFSQRTSIHEHATRRCNTLNVPYFKTCSGQRSFKYRAVKLWNELDENLKKIRNFNSFKRHLKSNMLTSFISS